MNTKADTRPSEIIIDLDLPQKEINEDELIQRSLYRDIKERVEERVKKLSQKEKQSFGQNAGWVSFIDGTRGAGKSTFLATTLTLLDKDTEMSLAILPVIDPSRIEANEFILLTILQELKRSVENTYKAASQEKTNDLKEWKNAFKKVAGGLALFQKDHHPLNELDADLFLDLGLERAGHSISLRSDLSNLFEKTCGVLGKKALLLAFDDADTNATHAITLLETIRKYLDTPSVMVMVTGDMELYSLLVRDYFHASLAGHRKHAWGQAASSDSRQKQLVRMQDHLEEQYLLKLFPINLRFRLRPMWDLIQYGQKDNPAVVFKLLNLNGRSDRELLAHVQELIQTGFRLKSSADVHLYTEFFLKQPLRSVLQVLSQTKEKNNYESKFIEAFLGFGLNSLYQFDVNTDGLANDNLAALAQAVFEASVLDGDFDTSAYLRPNGAKDTYKNALLTLSALVPHRLKEKPGDCLTYLFRGPGTMKLLIETINNHKYFDENSYKELQEHVRRYMGVGREDDALTWARLASTIIAIPYVNSPTTRVVRSGVIALNLRTRVKGLSTFSAVFDKYYGNQPAHVFSLMQVSGMNNLVALASIYNQVGLIGRLLKLAQDTNWNDKYDHIKDFEIKKVLNSTFPNLASVSVPPWLSKQNDGDHISKDPEEQESDFDSVNSFWINPIKEWLNHARGFFAQIYPSSVYLGKLWPRLNFVLETISNELRYYPVNNLPYQNSKGFAALMELYALSVVNAFLQEEASHHLPTNISLDKPRQLVHLNNPRRSAGIYLEQLAKVQEEIKQMRDQLPFTRIMATCPLITGLIREEYSFGKPLVEVRNTKKLWNNLFDEKSDFKFLSNSDFTSLSEISIQGRRLMTKTIPKDTDISDTSDNTGQ